MRGCGDVGACALREQYRFGAAPHDARGRGGSPRRAGVQGILGQRGGGVTAKS